MKKLALFMLICAVALSLCSCGGTADAPEVPAPEEVEETTGSGEGVYTFTEQVLDGKLQVVYTVELDEDGYTITVDDPQAKTTEYTGADWRWKDTYFTTGPMESGGASLEPWFNADTSCMWVVQGDGTVRPMNYVEQTAGAARLSNIAYADDSPSQVLDVHLPVGEGPFPVIVVLHGGGFRFGVIEGAGHEDPAFYTEENLAAVMEFLDGVLK